MDDVALVQQAVALNKDAFGAVYERYASRLYDYLWWVLQDREEATYALYDAFLEAGARLSDLREPSKLRPWLFAIASDQALRHRRKAEGRLDELPPPPPEADAAWGDLKQVVRALASDLTPQDRALLDLRYRHGLDDGELADAVGTTPERAAELLDRVTRRVEDLLGGTVVAFLARRDCPALTEELGPWDDRLDGRQREIVDEHAAACPTCGARRERHIPASSLLGVSPAMAVPGGVAERVLEDVELASHHRRPWESRRNGFPRPLIGYGQRRRLAVAAAAAAVLLVLAAAGYIVSRGGGTEKVASTGSTTVPSPTTTRPPTSLPALATTTSLPPLGEPGSASPGAGAAGGTGAGSGAAAPAGAGGGGGGGGSGGAAPSNSTSDTTPSNSNTTTPTTAPPPTAPPTTADGTKPVISNLSVNPSTVRPSSCGGTLPTQANVTATVTDNVGVSSVRVVLAGLSGANTPMTSSGGSTYTAVVGPFQSLVPPGTSVELPGQVIVRAVDAAGNEVFASADLTLRCTA